MDDIALMTNPNLVRTELNEPFAELRSIQTALRTTPHPD